MTETLSSGIAHFAKFSELFRRIAEGAAERERRRDLPTSLIRELADAGFTALRIPVEFGGSGVTIQELTELLLELAAADSNFVQILRAHFLYTEALLDAESSAERDQWLRRIAEGAVLGGAYTERTTENTTHFGTTITPIAPSVATVNGTKYYSTGSWFADWIITVGEGPDGIATAVLARNAVGVEVLNDWDGFGQRLTVSGTTRFTHASTADAPQLPPAVQPGSFGTSLAQFWHIVTLAGIARALKRDLLTYVRLRKRYFAQGAGVVPASDPVIQTVAGEIGAADYLATTVARQLAVAIDSLDAGISRGTVNEDHLDEIEIEVYRGQVVVSDAVLRAATRAFDVGGASAVTTSQGWDRHWRNARTIASHNPLPHRLVSIGDFDLNGTSPFRTWLSGIDLRHR